MRFLRWLLHLPIGLWDGLRDFHAPPGVVVQGLCTGLAFALLGIGLVLVYRSSRFINFAHGQIGAFGAAMLAAAVLQWHTPYWLAVPFGMAISAAVASGVEVVVVRRLANAPRAMSMIATLGVGQLLFFIAILVDEKAAGGTYFPRPAGFPTLSISGLKLNPTYSAMMVLAPALLIALILFFTRTRFGLAIRAAAANPDAAAMAAMSPRRLSTLTWAIAGALACVTSALLIPNLGALAGSAVGPTLMVRALAAAVIGRMQSLTVTFAAGIGIGLFDSLFRFNYGPGWGSVGLLVIIVVALLLQAKPGRREDEKGTWLAVQPWAPLPEAVRQARLVKAAPYALLGALITALVLMPTHMTNGHAYSFAVLLCYVMVGFSITIITGLGGQLSLGQLAIAGFGAAAALDVVGWTHDYHLGLLAAALTGAIVSVLIGLPALRVQGLLLAVVTLALALATLTFFLQQDPPVGFGTSRSAGRVSLLGLSPQDSKHITLITGAIFLLAFVLSANVRRSSFGRLLVALRDNEDAARAFGVKATRRKLQAYALAGMVAGLAGGALAYAQGFGSVSARTFAVDQGISIVTVTIVGGLGLLAGPILGAFVALPDILNAGPEVKGLVLLGWLVLILYCPNGVAGLLRPVRDRVVRGLAQLSGVDVERAYADADPARAASTAAVVQLPPASPRETTGQPLLVVDTISKRYGGLTAVDGVSLTVNEGEVLGLIGPNGAGKTTLFECLSGFVKVDGGSISFGDREITGWSPERRASAGLIRSFQDSALFSTLTVLETALVAGERVHPTHVASALTGMSRVTRQREQRARELISLLGLDRYRHTQIGSLSTGTRRIAELACLVALEPRLLLLDEPSSGIAQREVEALGEVLLTIKAHLDATLVVIEHDIALVSALSDRMVAMETGRILAVGTPHEVLTNEAVVESYLGGDPTAVHRSAADTTTARRTRTTSSPAEIGV